MTQPVPAPAGIDRRVLLRGGAGLGVALFGSAGLTSLLAGCGGDPTSDTAETITPGGILRAGVSSDPDSLDPHKSALDVAQEIYCGIFGRLVDVDAAGEIKPSIASGWNSPDDRTYLFTLRPDVTFHDGSPVTSADVVYTFDRIRTKSFGSISAIFFTAVDKVDAVSPQQVRFTLHRPSAAFLTNLAVYGHIVSKKAIESADPARNPVGTGPFMFQKWTQGQSVEIGKFAKYLEPGRPYLDGVRFTYLQNTEQRVLALRSRELDWVDSIPKQSIAQVSKDNTLRFIRGQEGTPQFLVFNSGRPPLNNKALRQAICWAINRDEIAKVAFQGTIEKGVAEFGKASRWYPANDPYASAPDENMVRKYLAEAGLPSGGVTIKYLAWTSSPDSVATAQVIEQQLQRYNIRLEIEQIEISSWLERVNAKNFELTLRLYGGLVDPDAFWSRNWSTTSVSNWSGYGGPELDAMIQAAGSELDPRRRHERYDEIRAMALTDGALLFTAFIPKSFVARRAVLGSEVYPGGDPRFRNIGLTK
jgi:peptide/nickel transport system substrate-binding protein